MKNKSFATSKEIIYKPIGVIHSEHTIKEKTPIQPRYSKGIKGTVEVYSEYKDGLMDIEGYSHLYLIYHFHKNETVKLITKPFLEDIEHGIFSTRAPFRPNGIGMSIVKLEKKEDNILFIEDVDILDGTPLLDIKPYSARFDVITNTRNGWQDRISEEIANTKGKREHKI